MISPNNNAHRATRRIMSLVLRFAADVGFLLLLMPATPSNMVTRAAIKVPTMTYANGWLNMGARLGSLNNFGKRGQPWHG